MTRHPLSQQNLVISTEGAQRLSGETRIRPRPFSRAGCLTLAKLGRAFKRRHSGPKVQNLSIRLRNPYPNLVISTEAKRSGETCICPRPFPRATLLLLLLLTACAPPRSNHIVIGAKNFTEQVILGELLAQEIEAVSAEQNHPQKVDRRFYLAGSYLCHQALVSGRIDAYVEYTGTALTAILKQPLPPQPDRTPDKVFATVSRLYDQRFHVKVEPSLGFEDSFAMVIRRDDADRLHLHTLSEATRLINSPQTTPNLPHPWRLGVGYEFESRPDGLPGLSSAYNLHVAAPPRTMDLGLLYRALAANQVDIVAGNSTDGPIRALHLAVLADDLHYFPPYQAVPLVREDTLAAHPEIQIAIDRLANKLTADEVQTMNDLVDAQHRDPAEVVRQFRAAHAL